MTYTPDFFKAQGPDSRASADAIVPLLIDLIHPRSVADVGCGTGNWLASFRENDVDDVLGVDGDWVRSDALQIPVGNFHRHDLSQPLYLNRRFDLALSVEVAEHLPHDVADDFVHALTSLSDVVAFSAAVPGQGGEHHVNEQWPSYWNTIFKQRGYTLVDCLRHRLWADSRVQAFYAQNLLLFVEADRLRSDARLDAERVASQSRALDIVHPKVFAHSLERASPERAGLKRWVRAAPAVFRTAVGNRLAKTAPG
jgi:SAM-dependent methyltransferase